MPRRKPASARLATQFAELALAAPQVVMHRTARMAAAGASPSARDRAEFARMSNEKVLAFYQSWAGMWAAGVAAQMELGAAVASAAVASATGNRSGAAAAAGAASRAAHKVVAAGLAPVHGKAVANAKRLSRHRR
jgi:hypothetical protein